MSQKTTIAAIALAFIVSVFSLARYSASVALAADAASPQPTATPRSHFITLRPSVTTLFMSQSSFGPGLQPVESPSFASGAPAAPVSPYDTFTGAPLVPGNVGQNQFGLDLGYRSGSASIGVTLVAESLVGDRTNEAYWAEPLLPLDNPHLGSPATGFSIKFPTHPGTDEYDAARLGIEQGRISLGGDRYLARIGWLDLKQSLGFVFTQPPTSNALPTLLLKTTESLNPNTLALDSWQSSPAVLPIRGIDFSLAAGSSTVEATDAELPSLSGTPARIVSLSFGHFDDSGHGAMIQSIRVHSGGAPIGTTTGFGAQPQILPTDQGLFALSTLYGQRQSITGARVARPVGLGIDATLDYARSTYQADGLGKPRSVGGSWDHISLSHPLGAATFAAHYYRFEPTFATMVLPYGTPENVWSVAYSWPGPWLKSNFQLVDTTAAGVNRQGITLDYSLVTKTLTAAASFGSYRQISPFTTANFHQLGFIDGFFLVQPDPSRATLGGFKHGAVYLGKTFAFGTVGLDFVDDGLHRPSGVGEPFDAVSFDAPEYVASWSRPLGAEAVLSAGAGYYGIRGTWADGAATNVDVGMHTYYVGAQLQEQGGRALMLTARKSLFRGAPYSGALHALRYGLPDFNAVTLLLEQRIRL